MTDAVAGIHAHITRYYLESGLGQETPPSKRSTPQQKGTNTMVERQICPSRATSRR